MSKFTIFKPEGPTSGVGPTQHVSGGKAVIDFSPTRRIGDVLLPNAQPPEIASLYSFSLSPRQEELTIDPKAVMRTRDAVRRGGFSARDSENGGKVIALYGGPFNAGEWITSSFSKLVKGRAQLADLTRAGYDLDVERQLLVVTSRNDSSPTVFAFSRDPKNLGLVAVCSEVTVLDFVPGGGGGSVLVRKPVIYLYPTKPTDVRVQVSLAGQFVAQYPKAKDGVWNVHASPDGTLFDRASERRYSYLFWEGTNDGLSIDPDQSFCVAAKDAESFLEKACTSFALNDKEKTDFISYWLPHLEKNALSMVQFLSVADYERYAHMRVTPEPESVIRMFMVFRKAHGLETVGNPDLPRCVRKGFTVVEWGGANLDERV